MRGSIQSISTRQLTGTPDTRVSQLPGTYHLSDSRMREGELLAGPETLLAGLGEDSQGNQNSQHRRQTQPATPEQGADSGFDWMTSCLTTAGSSTASKDTDSASLASDSDSLSVDSSSIQCRWSKDRICPSDRFGYPRRMKEDRQPFRHSSQEQKFCSLHSSRITRQFEQKHRNEGDLEQKNPLSFCTEEQGEDCIHFELDIEIA